MVKAVFVGGASSNAGKSWIATALCRYYRQRGLRVAPFKAQNMSNNSFPCSGGGEIGRSQATQAAACGLAPEPAMNPVLLKPCGDSHSQVVVEGRVWRTLEARDYYRHVPALRAVALAAYRSLAARFDLLVIEGAGSVAELNLADRDFVNLSFAAEVGASALLVADIERGGVFASLLGTLDLLPPEHRRLHRAFAVNRFRGDPALFDDGRRLLEERSGLPCLGVFPFAPGLTLPAEDSLAEPAGEPLDAAVIRFPRLSNSTDLALLGGAVWLDTPVSRRFSAVILPGSKSTLADLAWLRERGLDAWIRAQHASGASILGVCGGYQMLGEHIFDPFGHDGTAGSAPGLGLLPVSTVMHSDKRTQTREAQTLAGTPFPAYEIHLGETTGPGEPFARLAGGEPEGRRQGRVFGTYLHGALESPAVLAEYLGLRVTPPAAGDPFDRLAAWLTASADPALLDALAR